MSIRELTYFGGGAGSKYKNRSSSCIAKHLHDSRIEAAYCDELFVLKRAGEVLSYEIQYKVEIYVRKKKICNHYVDFYVVYPDGHAEFHEVKGYDTDVWKLKKKLVEVLFPDILYKVVRKPGSWRR